MTKKEKVVLIHPDQDIIVKANIQVVGNKQEFISAGSKVMTITSDGILRTVFYVATKHPRSLVNPVLKEVVKKYCDRSEKEITAIINEILDVLEEEFLIETHSEL